MLKHICKLLTQNKIKNSIPPPYHPPLISLYKSLDGIIIYLVNWRRFVLSEMNFITSLITKCDNHHSLNTRRNPIMNKLLDITISLQGKLVEQIVLKLTKWSSELHIVSINSNEALSLRKKLKSMLAIWIVGNILCIVHHVGSNDI